MQYIQDQLTYMAATEPSGDLFGSLGIDWTLLGLQTLAFLVLLFVLKKFVYPPIVSMLDKRDEAIRASADAAMEAEQHAAEAEARTAELLDEAKREAAEIVATAKVEASQTTEDAIKKAELKTESMMSGARDELAKEVETAKRSLEANALELISLATAKVLNEKLDDKKDQSLIEQALKESK